eukprot:gene2218-biopygen6148
MEYPPAYRYTCTVPNVSIAPFLELTGKFAATVHRAGASAIMTGEPADDASTTYNLTVCGGDEDLATEWLSNIAAQKLP